MSLRKKLAARADLEAGVWGGGLEWIVLAPVRSGPAGNDAARHSIGRGRNGRQDRGRVRWQGPFEY